MKHLRIIASELPGSVAAPWGLKAFERLIIGALLATLTMLIFSNSAHAVPINLIAAPGSPDIVTTNTGVKYLYTPGGGGVLTIEGVFGGPAVQTVVTVPSWTYLGAPVASSLNIVKDDSGANSLLTNYNLVANFDADGNFVAAGSTLEVTGVIDAVFGGGFEPLDRFSNTLAGSPCFGLTCGHNGLGKNGENLLMKSNLLGFGWVGNPAGVRDSLLMEFYMEIVGGDFATAGYNTTGIREDVGVIASGLVNYGTTSAFAAGGNFGGVNWDDDVDANPVTIDAFQNDFISCSSGCVLLVDTFVPVPAAVWLFGSGLLGLIGVGARNRRNR